MTATAQLPFRQDHPLQSSEELRALQSDGPIHKVQTPVGDEAWLVTGYAQVRRLMDDENLGRTHRDPANAPRSRTSALFGGPIGDFDTEPADHARMRSAAAAALLPQTHAGVAAEDRKPLHHIARRPRAAGTTGRPACEFRPAVPRAGDLRPARRAVLRPGPLPGLGRGGRLLPGRHRFGERPCRASAIRAGTRRRQTQRARSTTSSPGCATSPTSATSRSPRWACSCCSPGTRPR